MRFDYFASSALLLALAACSTGPATDGIRFGANSVVDPPYELKSLPIPIEILEAQTRFLPPLFNVRDEVQLRYELELANAFHYPMRLKQIEIMDLNKPSSVLRTFDADYLEQHLLRPGIKGGHSLLGSKPNQPLEKRRTH